jgi:hypothetical protein
MRNRGAPREPVRLDVAEAAERRVECGNETGTLHIRFPSGGGMGGDWNGGRKSGGTVRMRILTGNRCASLHGGGWEFVL